MWSQYRHRILRKLQKQCWTFHLQTKILKVEEMVIQTLTFCLQKSSSHNQPLNGLHGPHTVQLVSAYAKKINVTKDSSFRNFNNQIIISPRGKRERVSPRHQKLENLLPWFEKFLVDILTVQAKSWKISLVSSATSNITSTIWTVKEGTDIQ